MRCRVLRAGTKNAGIHLVVKDCRTFVRIRVRRLILFSGIEELSSRSGHRRHWIDPLTVVTTRAGPLSVLVHHVRNVTHPSKPKNGD